MRKFTLTLFAAGILTLACRANYFYATAGGGAPPPGVAVEDTFTASNGTALDGRTPSPTTAGFNWDLLTGSSANVTIESNRATITDNIAVVAPILVVDSGTADGTITCTVQTTTFGSAAIFVWFRTTDENNGLFLQLGVGSSIVLRKIVSGVATTIDGPDVQTLNPNEDIDISITLSGNSISASVITQFNGTGNLTATESFNATATSHGLQGFNNVMQCDDFKVESP